MSHPGKEGFLNEKKAAEALKEKRMQYGMSQNRLAVAAGISREYLSRLESGKCPLTEDMRKRLEKALAENDPDAPLTMLFDYVRIRFPTNDAQHVIEKILKLKFSFMIEAEYGFYSYDAHYYMGDIFVFTSHDEDKGTLLELKGKGCRQFEAFLLAQHRSWFDFFMDAIIAGGVFKRLDLAINDMSGILDVAELAAKCDAGECISVFRSFKSYRSGELVRQREQDKSHMGNTLYIGSVKSEVYFCIYEKDYEQYVRLGIPLEDAPIKNRFEIRLKNERASEAVRDLLTYYDAERTAFSIINRYIRFAERNDDKRRSEWKTSPMWARFLGDGRGKLKLTTEPAPYTFEKSLAWLKRQVAPTLKAAQRLDAIRKTSVVRDMVREAKLSERLRKILIQQAANMEDMIIEDENGN